MKKIIILLIPIIILLIVSYFCYINMNTVVNINWGLNGESIKLNSYIIMLCFYLLGLYAGSSLAALYKIEYGKKLSFYTKRNEQLAMQKEADTDDKEVLKRKIATLEIALEQALKNK